VVTHVVPLPLAKALLYRNLRRGILRWEAPALQSGWGTGIAYLYRITSILLTQLNTP
jgi:hypothetical protein